MKISKITIHNEQTSEIKILDLGKFLENTFGYKVEIKDIQYNNFEKITQCEISNRFIPFKKQTRENSVEDKNIVMYDGFELQKTFAEIIPDITLDNLHIIITSRITCTYDDTDYRYHARALIGSNPAIISTTGIIEAPAKPKEYYLDLIYNKGLESIEKKYEGTYLKYHDSRMPKVIQGYILQAVFYYATGEAFCDVSGCMLYNAHWQKDLLYSQIEIGKLCKRHQDVLDKVR